jgi:hypothetical protein
MSTAKKRGPGPSHLLIGPDIAGNVVGIDPHKQTLTATIVDPCGAILASEHFRVSGDGHRARQAWALGFGPIARWGVEGASSWGRHTARVSRPHSWSERRAAGAHRSVAELLVEVGDPRRFTEGGFARFNATAPLPASTAEGPGEPVRHRYNPGGNRRIDAVLHRMAITQLRCEPRAQAIFAAARAKGHTKKEARRILKRHLSDVSYRRMIRDQAAHLAQLLAA